MDGSVKLPASATGIPTGTGLVGRVSPVIVGATLAMIAVVDTGELETLCSSVTVSVTE